jgi:hypothetical protein
MYFVARDGTILQMAVDRISAGTKFYVPQALEANASGGTGLRPAGIDLNADETLFGVVSEVPPGLYIIPVLGPDGARTTAQTGPLAAGETPPIRWLDRQ